MSQWTWVLQQTFRGLITVALFRNIYLLSRWLIQSGPGSNARYGPKTRRMRRGIDDGSGYPAGASSKRMAAVAMLLVSQFGCASGTGSIAVTVTDELGNGLPGAMVTVGGVNGATDAQGTAYLPGVPAGTHKVDASVVGFRPCGVVTAHVRADHQAKATVRLQIKAAHGTDESGPCRPAGADPAKPPDDGA